MSSIIKDYMKTGLTLVNHSNIGNYRNKYAIVHGKVQSFKNRTINLLMDPQNNHEILINGFKDNQISVGDFVAIIGRVASDKSLDFFDMFPLDKDFDLDFLNEIIPISNNSNAKIFFERT